MKLSYQIEHQLPNGEYDYLDVEFEADFTKQNDSFDYAGTHCTNGVSGTCVLPDYLVIEDIGWDAKKFSDQDNMIIKTFLADDKNYEEIVDLFAKQYN